jgi:hypothetical protein
MKFTLSFKNPCVDTDFVNIVAPVSGLKDYEYIIDTTQIDEAHDSFTVSAVPGPNLCGALTYTMKIDGDVIDEDDLPIGYEDSTRNVIIDSDDRGLDGTQKTYVVTAVFTDPDNRNDEEPPSASGTIDFKDPCYEDFTLVAQSQNNPDADNFSGNTISVDFVEFVISPSYCTVSNACISVVRRGFTDSELTCDDLTFTDLTSTGDFSLSVDKDDYISSKVKPGFYDVTIKGTATDSTAQTSVVSVVVL